MDFVDVIIREFKKKQEKNSQFSLRSYAQRLGVDPSVLSKVMSRKRGLSVDLARKISRHLELSVEDNALLPAQLLDEEHPYSEYTLSNIISPLVAAYFKSYPERSVESVAQFFDLPEPEINACVEDLLGKGILEKENGRFLVKDDDIFFNFEEDIEQVKKFYTEFYVNRWRSALERGETSQNYTVLIPFDECSAPLMEQELLKMATRLGNVFSDFSPPKRLYSVVLGAFPLGDDRVEQVTPPSEPPSTDL